MFISLEQIFLFIIFQQKKNQLATNIESIKEEIISKYLQNEIKINNQSKKLKKNKDQIIRILPYENTYGQFYYPDQFISIEKTMIDKIINGVQAMATSLTNTVNKKKSISYSKKRIF